MSRKRQKWQGEARIQRVAISADEVQDFISQSADEVQNSYQLRFDVWHPLRQILRNVLKILLRNIRSTGRMLRRGSVVLWKDAV